MSEHRRQYSPRSYKYIIINGKPVMEHRWVMSQILGRPLLRTEIIHHKDKNKRNNSPSNLELFSSNSEHIRSHAISRRFANETHKRCARCHEIKPRADFAKRTPKPNTADDPNHIYCRPCASIIWKERAGRKGLLCTVCGRENCYAVFGGVCGTCRNKKWLENSH